jgi:ribosomal protein L16 Arg81 hydroxylase
MGTRTPTFAELVGDEDEFFATYHTRRSLLRRGAVCDPREILSVADMDEIVHQEGMRPSLLRMLGQGTGVAGASLTRRLELRREGKAFDDALAPEKVYAHFRAGKTLIHAGLNHTRPNLRRLCAMLTERFAAPAEAVAYLTPAGQQGARAHSDPSDVYVIQLEGTKHWQVWETPRSRRLGVDRDYDLAELRQPILDVSLRPGDVLYVPYGTPHVAAAEEQVSLHVTVVSLARTWAQLLLPMLEQVLDAHEEFWTAPYAGDDPALLSAAVHDRVDALVEHLARVDLATGLQQRFAVGRGYEGVAQQHFFAETAAADGIDERTLVAGVPGASTIHPADNGTTLVTVHGNKLRMPETIAVALVSASGVRPVRAGDFLPGDGAERSLASVKQLVRLGALRVVADDRTPQAVPA